MSRENVVEAPFHGSIDRRSALDRAHLGDLEGALGTVGSHDAAPRLPLRRRIATLLAVMGPGLIVLVADNDAGGVAMYAQAGQDHGLWALWVLLLLAPVLFVNQEMVARLGAVTGAGHARLIFERFGRRWGMFALGDLLALNLLTVATEFIGISLALGYFGISRYVAVPVAAVLIVVVTAGGSFSRWERVMFTVVAANVVAVPLLLLVSLHHGPAPRAIATAPGIGGGAVLLVVALVGTTVAPWQLFFQQSNVVDKRISARWLSYERVDTAIGTGVGLLCAAALVVVCAIAFRGTPLAGAFVDAGSVAAGLRSVAGPIAGALFALVLLNGSLLGAAAVTLSSAYAVGEVVGVKHSLHRGWRDARVFHATFAISIVLGASVVLLPGAPPGVITTVVQALAGILLPSASVMLLLLCNDPAVLGPWTNPRWLNVLATAVVGAMVVLSAMLTVTTVFRNARPEIVVAALAGLGVLVFLAWGAMLAWEARRRGRRVDLTPWERRTWTMPPLETLAPPPSTRGRTLGMVMLRGYLLVTLAVLLLGVFQLLPRP